MDDRVAGWFLALAIGASLILIARRDARLYAVAAVAFLLLYVIALAMATWLIAAPWRPLVPAIAAAAVWLVIQPLFALGRLRREEVGLIPPRPGSLSPALAVTAAAVAANTLIIYARGPDPLPVSATLVGAVVIAALMEELVMRGAILALADRAAPPRWRLAGAPIGTGGLLVTAAFVALHGLRPGLLLGVAPAAILYLWLRARSGSLLPPMLAHVLWNLSVVLLHR
jgi:membrane protease YdiL (CAAX protease family)